MAKKTWSRNLRGKFSRREREYWGWWLICCFSRHFMDVSPGEICGPRGRESTFGIQEKPGQLVLFMWMQIPAGQASPRAV